MDLEWQEEQRAFQARVLIDEPPDLTLRPYRTFVGAAASSPGRRAGRWERLAVTLAAGVVIMALLVSLGAAREIAAVVASITGGFALMLTIAPRPASSHPARRTPLLALYPPTVLRGAPPTCVTQITVDELAHLGVEGFGTVVGQPAPSATFGLFVDDHLVWPRTPPRAALPGDPGFGTA